MGDVAVGLGGALVSPPQSVDQVKCYFGKIKWFPAIAGLIDVINNGVSVRTLVTNLDCQEQ